MLDQSRTPHVSPELLRRSSGMIGGGVVSCVGCGAVTPLATATIAKLGYRCQGCSDHASFANGSVVLRTGAVSRPVPRARRRSNGGSELIWIGICVLVLGAIVAPLVFWWIGIAAMIVGSVTTVVGITRRNAPY